LENTARKKLWNNTPMSTPNATNPMTNGKLVAELYFATISDEENAGAALNIKQKHTHHAALAAFPLGLCSTESSIQFPPAGVSTEIIPDAATQRNLYKKKF
jgi:hypothetical protein